jgi:hypothetical protein
MMVESRDTTSLAQPLEHSKGVSQALHLAAYDGPPKEGSSQEFRPDKISTDHNEALHLSARPKTGSSSQEFHPDQIHSNKERVDAWLRSAYIESTNGTPSGSKHALEDHKEAIRAADSVGNQWLNREQDAMLRSLNPEQQAKAELRFEEQIDRLPPDVRQRVNNLRFRLKEDYNQHGAQAWTTQAGNVEQIMRLLPPDMQKTFTQLRQTDEQQEKTMNALGEARDLEQYPLKTRMLAARELAKQGNLEGSREMMNEMLKLSPELVHSPQFGKCFENPRLLSENIRWDGNLHRSQQKQAPESIIDQLIKKLEKLERGTDEKKPADSI